MRCRSELKKFAVICLLLIHLLLSKDVLIAQMEAGLPITTRRISVTNVRCTTVIGCQNVT